MDGHATTSMNLRLDGLAVLVTGAGSGLGRAHALALAERGASVVVNDLGVTLDGEIADTSRAEQVAAEIVALGGVAIANTGSVALPGDADAMVADAIDAFGRLDAAVCNAGILRDQALHNVDDVAVAEVFGVHVFGTFYVARAAVRVMREQGGGRIVLTTSASGLYGNHGQTVYGAAKTAMLGLARSLALEGAPRGIHVNVVAPLGSSRMSESLFADSPIEFPATDVAAVVTYLAHPSCMLNGRCLSVGAGRVAEVIVAETAGMRAEVLTPETVRDGLEAWSHREKLYEPSSLREATELAAGDRGARFAATRNAPINSALGDFGS